MATGNEALFRELFPSFFLCWPATVNRVGAALKDQDERAFLVYSTEPTVDVLELSGYALLYTELDGKSYWDIVKSLWDDYCAQVPDPQALLKLISTTANYRQSLFAILPRDLLRSAWRQDFQQRLRILGVLEDGPLPSRFGYRDDSPKHASRLIRVLVRGGEFSFFEDAQDVFLVGYLMERPEAAGIELPPRARNFAEALEREKLRESAAQENGTV